MIFVVDSKNKTHGPISNWNAVNVGKISKVILTDGMGITSYLSGFSKYGAEFEAISILKGNGQGVKHRVVKEIIIGVHDTKKAERELLESFNNNLKSIMDSNKNVQERINKCREKYDYMLTDLLNKRVVKKSLEIKTELAQESTLPDKALKDGTGEECSAVKVWGPKFSRKLSTWKK